MSIKVKFPLLITLLILVASGSVFAVMFILYMNEVEKEIAKRGMLLAKVLADVDISVFTGIGDYEINDRILHSKLENIIKEPDVEGAAYCDENKIIIYKKGKVHTSWGKLSSTEFICPIGKKGKILGYAYVKLQKEVITNAKKKTLKRIIPLGILITIFSLMISIPIAFLLTRPILKLNQMAQEFGKGNFNVRVKVSSKDEIGSLAQTFNKMSERIKNLFMKLKEKHEMLQRVLKEATEDGLTGLFVYRHFMRLLEGSIEIANKYGIPLSLIMIDIDDFKKINDTYGHEKGNEVLKKVAKVISEHIRKEKDIAGRYGGEEFSVLLEETDKNTAIEIAEKLRKRVENEFKNDLNVTISLGVTTSRNPENSKKIIEIADKALYISKREGKNRVTFLET